MNLDIPPWRSLWPHPLAREGRRRAEDAGGERPRPRREAQREVCREGSRGRLGLRIRPGQRPRPQRPLAHHRRSPFVFRSKSGAHEGSYSLRLSRNVPGKHRVDGKLSYERSSFVNSAAQEVVSESHYSGRLIYEYGFFTESIRPFSFASYGRLRENDLYPVRMAVSFGPIGLKYYFEKPSDSFEEITLGIFPRSIT